MKQNLVSIYDQLSVQQRAFLCRTINLAKEANGDNGWLHLGILPFVTKEEAIGSIRGALDRTWANTRGERLLRELLSILGNPGFERGTSRFLLRLNDKKVYRQFGKNPERGKPLLCLPKEKVAVGFTNRFGKLKVDTEVLVHPAIQLKKLSPGYWAVEIASRHRKAAEEWLLTNCR